MRSEGLRGYHYSTQHRIERLSQRGLPTERIACKVRCDGALHTIALMPGGALVLEGHPKAQDKADAVAAALADTRQAADRCHGVLAEWRRVCAHGGGVSKLPEPLRDIALACYVRRSWRQSDAQKHKRADAERREPIYALNAPVALRCQRAVEHYLHRYRARWFTGTDGKLTPAGQRLAVIYDGTYGRLVLGSSRYPDWQAAGTVRVSIGCVARAVRIGSQAFAVDQRGRELHFDAAGRPLILGPDGKQEALEGTDEAE